MLPNRGRVSDGLSVQCALYCTHRGRQARLIKPTCLWTWTPSTGLDSFHWNPISLLFSVPFLYGSDHFFPPWSVNTYLQFLVNSWRLGLCCPTSECSFFFFVYGKPIDRTTFFQDSGLALWFACAGEMKFTPEPQLLTRLEAFSCSLRQWLLPLWCAPILKLQFCFGGNSSKVTIWLSP